MIIQCPKCSTRWRVGDPAATDNPVFKCGRCHNVFPQFPGALPPTERNGTSTKARDATPEPDNLEFIFPRRATVTERTPTRADAIAPLRELVSDPPRRDRAATVPAPAHSASATPAPRVADAPPSAGMADTEAPAPPPTNDLLFPLPDESQVAAAPECDDEEDLALIADEIDVESDGPSNGDDDRSGPTTLDGDDEPSFELGADEEEDDDAVLDMPMPVQEPVTASRVVDVEAAMRASARTRAFQPATRLLLTLVVAFAVLAVFLRANPARSDEWLGRIPLVGMKLAADPALGDRITLSDVQGGYQHLRTGRRIFVISGKATNNALVPVERIEVEGALYAASGNVDRKVISTGNKTTLKLRDLTESEIALLQKLDARQPVAPGGSVDFAIVFLEPPRDLREFSSRVLTVRSTGRVPGQTAPGNPASVG